MGHIQDRHKNIQVRVHRRPNMFKVQESLYNLMGYGELEQMFTNPAYKVEGGSIHLWFPERFLNIVEQRKLIERIEKAGYETAKIETHSVYIIQCTSNVVVYEHEMPGDVGFKNSVDQLFGLPSGETIGCLGGTIQQAEGVIDG